MTEGHTMQSPMPDSSGTPTTDRKWWVRLAPRPWARALLDFIFGYDFFISYSHGDGKHYPRRLAERLEQAGFRAFLDERVYVAGDDLRRATRRRVRMSTALSVMARSRAMNSYWVGEEVRESQSANRRVVVIDVNDSFAAAPPESRLRTLLDEPLLLKEQIDNPDGEPSDHVIEGLMRSFNATRQETRQLRVFATAALILATVAVVAVWQWRRAVRSELETAREARQAVAGRLAAEAKAALLAQQPQRALLLSSAAVHTPLADEPIPTSAEESLREALAYAGGYGLAGHTGDVTGLHFLNGSNNLLTTDQTGVALLWDLRSSPPFSSTRVDKGAGRLSYVGLEPTQNVLTLITATGNVTRQRLPAGESYGADLTLAGYDATSECTAAGLSWLFQAADGGSLHFWEWQDATPPTQVTQTITTEGFNLCRFSDSGNWLFFTDFANAVGLVDLRRHGGSWPVIRLRPQDQEVTDAWFDPNERWLAVGYNDGVTHLWDLTAGVTSQADKVLPGASDQNLVFGFANRHAWVATGAANGEVRLWQIDDATAQPLLVGQAALPFEFPAIGGGELAFAPDDGWLYAGDGLRAAALLNLQNGPDSMTVVPLHLHPSAEEVDAFIYAPWAFHESPPLLVTTSDDHFVHLWDLSTSNPERRGVTLRGHDGAVVAVRVSDDGRWLATGSFDGTARLWDLGRASWIASPTVLPADPGARVLQATPWNPFAGVEVVEFGLHSSWLESYGDAHLHRLTFLDAMGNVTRTIQLDDPDAFSARLAAEPELLNVALALRSLRIQEQAIAYLLKQAELQVGADQDLVYAIAEDQPTVAVAIDSDIWLWNRRDPSVAPTRLRTDIGPATTLALSGSGNRLLAINVEKEAQWWRLDALDAPPVQLAIEQWLKQAVPLATPEGQEKAADDEFSTESASLDGAILEPYDATLSRDGRWLLFGFEYLLDLTQINPGQAWSLPVGAWETHVLAGDIVVKQYDNQVLAWDLSRGDETPNALTVPRIVDYSSALAYSSASRTFVFGLLDGRVALIRYELSGELTPLALFAAHDRQVSAVAVDATGRLVASSSGRVVGERTEDDTKLWRQHDDGTWQAVGLTGHKAPVSVIRFSPDGRWLATGGEDNQVLIHDLDLTALIQRAALVAGRTLSAAEQERFGLVTTAATSVLSQPGE